MRGSINDDDGRRAAVGGLVNEARVAALQRRILKSGHDIVKFCRAFGIVTLNQLPAAAYDDAIALLARIERLNKYRAALSYKEIEESEEDPLFFERIRGRSKAGMGWDKAYHLTLAQEIAKGRPWPQWLLELCAMELLTQYEPMLKARWERKVRRPAIDRAMINYWADRLKTQRVHNPRTQAEKLYAESLGLKVGREGVSALRKRRQRARKT